jgi:hypothetical protein
VEASASPSINLAEFQLATQGNDIKISRTIAATLTDFKIEPRTLLTLPVKNEIPVRVEMT